MLIDSTLVKELGLRHFRLHKLLPISVALNNLTTSESHLYKYIKIAPYSLDSAWTSRTLKAIVTPKLCVPILLRLPFLSINHFVANFKLCSAIDKINNYDLLKPAVPKA